MKFDGEESDSQSYHLGQYISRPLPRQSKKQSAINADKSFLTVFETGTGVAQVDVYHRRRYLRFMMVRGQGVWVHSRYDGLCGQE